MFGKQSKDPKKSETPDIPEMMFPPASPPENAPIEEIEMAEIDDIEQPEMVRIAEKISSVVSPYFIVIVGLLLYDNNFILGLILIIIGIFSLLKISWSDIFEFFLEIKSIFSSSDEP